MGDVPFMNELETLVGNQFIAKHGACFNRHSNTTFCSNPCASGNNRKPLPHGASDLG